jgi:hypothetical protein
MQIPLFPNGRLWELQLSSESLKRQQLAPQIPIPRLGEIIENIASKTMIETHPFQGTSTLYLTQHIFIFK